MSLNDTLTLTQPPPSVQTPNFNTTLYIIIIALVVIIIIIIIYYSSRSTNTISINANFPQNPVTLPVATPVITSITDPPTQTSIITSTTPPITNTILQYNTPIILRSSIYNANVFTNDPNFVGLRTTDDGFTIFVLRKVNELSTQNQSAVLFGDEVVLNIQNTPYLLTRSNENCENPIKLTKNFNNLSTPKERWIINGGMKSQNISLATNQIYFTSSQGVMNVYGNIDGYPQLKVGELNRVPFGLFMVSEIL